jgi:hypothetical protein
MDPEKGLKAVLKALALPGKSQLKLYPRSECTNCRFSTLYADWVEHFHGGDYLAGLDPARREALARIDAASKSANAAPCYEPQYLTEGAAFQELRSVAKAALESFGWTKGTPDPRFLWGHAECAKLVRANLKKERAARLRARSPSVTEEDFGDIPDFDPRGLTVAHFRALLGRVPWFAHLGKPHPRDESVERIDDWSDWRGPESTGGGAIGPEQSLWHEELLKADRSKRARIKKLWDEVTSECFRAVAKVFQEDLSGDPWDGPSNAAGHAAWVAATIACSLELAHPIPRNALRQWAWFARGHWPCMYSEDDDIRYVEGTISVESLERAWLVVY